MRRRRAGSLCLAILLGLTVTAADPADPRALPREAVIEDIRYFLSTLESVHPDPYTAFGGKVAFKRRARQLIEEVPEGGVDTSGVYRLLMAFIADLGDGHTQLRAPGAAPIFTGKGELPLGFEVAADAIFVGRARATQRELIGRRLAAVNGAPVQELGRKVRRLVPVENEFGAYRALARHLTNPAGLIALFGDEPDPLPLTLLDAGGKKEEVRIRMADDENEDEAEEWVAPTWEGISAGREPIWWQIIDEGRAGYLGMRSIEGREAFLQARGRSDLHDYVERYYRQFEDREAPADLDAAVNGVPCFTGTVSELLTAMKKRGVDDLIVDLTENGGGWSSLMTPLYVLVYGRDYLDYPFSSTWIDVASPQLLEMNGWSAKELASAWGPDFAVGDYRFQVEGPPAAGKRVAEYAAGLEPMGCGLAALVAGLGGRPLYRPRVTVLVDSGTFSAAFQAACKLRHLGARLVGVPPAQAGNAFTNVLPVRLPRSGLSGSIARSVQSFFPPDSADAEALMPDKVMTWEDYRRHGFDVHAELLEALDLIRREETEGLGR